MTVLGVGVVAGGATTRVHLLNLAHRNQLVEGVVHRRQAHLWETSPCPLEHFFRCEVDVVTPHRLGYDPPLGRQAPAHRPQAVEKRSRGHGSMYTRQKYPLRINPK